MHGEPTGLHIGRTAVRLARIIELALSRIDVSIAQFRILVQLSEGTEASSLLASQLAVSPPSITTVVDGLVNRGLVARQPSPGDRRRVALTLTPEGEKLLATADLAVSTRLTEIAGELNDPASTKKALESLDVWEQAFELTRAKRLSRTAGVASATAS